MPRGPFGCARGGIRTVECVEKHAATRAHPRAVEAAAVPGRAVKIFHEIKLRVVGVGGEVVKARAAEDGLELATGLQDSIPQGLGLQSTGVHAPEQAVTSINAGGLRANQGSLSPGGGFENEPVNMLEAPLVGNEFGSKPVEQGGV